MKISIFPDSEWFFDFFDLISEPSNYATTSVYRDEINFVHHDFYRSGTSSLQLLEEDYMTHHCGLMFKMFSPFLEIYNEVKLGLESNGVMEKWRRDNEILETNPEELGPQVLTMEHLKIGFLACLIPAIISLIAFVGELSLSETIIALKRRYHNKIENYLKSMVKAQPTGHTQQTLVEDNILKELDEILIEKPSVESQGNLDDDSDSLDGMIEKLDFRAIASQQNPPKPTLTN